MSSFTRKRPRSLALMHGLAVLALATACGPTATAQLPATRLGSLFPSGAQAGTAVDVVIAGADLDDVDQLHFSHAGIKAEMKMAEPGPFDKEPQPVPNAFVITVAGNTPPGLYEARAVGRYGISNPRAFVVTDLKQVVEEEPNDKLEEATELDWPVAVAGRSDRVGDVDYYKFTAKPNERILIRCLARCIDSRMDPTVVVYDSNGGELQSSRDGRNDPLIDFTPPSAGEYYLKVFDSLYDGSEDHFYRLRVGILPHIDFVFPPAGQAGGNRPVTIFGRNLPNGQAAGITIDGKAIQKLDVNVPLPNAAALDDLAFNSIVDSEGAGIDGKEYRLAGPQGLSNPVLVGVATTPVVVEQEPNNTPAQAQELKVPCEVAGQFFPARDQDWYQFQAEEGEEWVVELFSQRLGRPTDPSLIVQRIVPAEEDEPERIEMVGTSDDATAVGAPEFRARTFDPALHFTAPADGTYRVLVRDSYSELMGDPRNVYRLVVRQPQPDFRLVAASGNPHAGALLMRKGGSTEVRVVAYRRDGYDGEIKVSVSGLPSGVTCPSVVIGPAKDSATLVLTAAENAAEAFGLIEVTGEAPLGTATVNRKARFGTPLWPLPQRPANNPQPPGPARLARNLAVSVSADETAPILLQAGADKVWETSRGGILKIPYTITRRNGFNGNVVCMVTDLPPNITVQPFTINGNQGSGEFQLTLTANTPPGTYTCFLSALVQPLPYTRNPDAAKKAADRKAELDKIVAELTTKSQEATKNKTDADKLATDTAAAVQAATTAKENADKAAEEAVAVQKTKAEEAAKAKAAAAADKDDAQLVAADAAAKKAADDAATAAKVAMEAAVAAQKALDDANANAKAAADDKVVKDQAAEEAAELLAAGQAAKAEADRRATETATAAQQRNLNNVYLPSTSVTLKITPAPITMSAGSASLNVKQAEMAELPISINRLYDFNEQVTLSAVLPRGIAGLSIPNVAIPRGQNQAKLAINAAANATDGEHAIVVRATMALNGQQLIVEEPVTVKVEKVEPTE